MIEERLETKDLLMIPLNKGHLQFYINWRNSPLFLSNCTFKKPVKDLEELHNEITADFNYDRHLQYIVFKPKTKIPVGTLYSYGYNSKDLYVFISAFFISRKTSLISFKAFIQFVKYLFEKYSLYKIYCDTYEYNFKMNNIFRKLNLLKEGIFKKQHIHNNKRFDVYRYAIYIDDLKRWESKYEKALD